MPFARPQNMAEPSESTSLDAQELSVDLRTPSGEALLSGGRRSQTVPGFGCRNNVVGRRSSKPATQSHTIPILSGSTSLLDLNTSNQATATPDYMAVRADLESQLPTPLNPIRPSDPQAPQANAWNAENETPNSRRVLILWTICCVAFFTIAPLISIILGVKLHTRDLLYSPSQDVTSFPGRRLDMWVTLVSADPLQSVVTFDWVIFSDENGLCTNITITNGSCTDVNIFIDSNLLAGNVNNLQQSSDVPTVPLFWFNATTWWTRDMRSNAAIFRTNILAFSRDGIQSSLVNYPFDVYVSRIYMFAQDAKNHSLDVGLRIIGSSGNAVGFSTSAVDCDASTIPPAMMCIDITIKRGVIVQVFCIIVTIGVWLITMILFLLTFTSIIFGFRQKAEVLIVPVATIFACTQLRSSMPGAPSGFGDILDFVGLLPCLGILSFSAALSLGAFILTDPTQKAEVLSWGRLRRELLHMHNTLPTRTEKEANESESEYFTAKGLQGSNVV